MTREEAEREADLWGVNDPERMNADTPNEAIGCYLEECGPERMPETVTLQGFRRMQPTENDCGYPLERVLERLDEEHGDPDERGTTPTPKMLEAEKAFKAAILAEYKVWSCEEIYSEEVNVREWCERTGNLDLLKVTP